MTSRERVRRTFQFKPTDRVPFDFMESTVWPELMAYFKSEMGLADTTAVYEHFDNDFRWAWVTYKAPGPATPAPEMSEEEKLRWLALAGTYSDHVMKRPLRDAETPADLDKYNWPNPEHWDASVVKERRAEHPDRAIIMLPFLLPPFMTACSSFGIEEALVKMIGNPKVFEAFIARLTEICVVAMERCCKEAEGVADICWMMDDVASQRALMMNPDLWRRYLKEPIRKQCEIAHKYGLFTIFHSCGSVRSILPDLIDIGVDAHLTFQTTAEGMDAESIARDFGGKIVFYGGMDVQQLLTFASEDEVRREVRKNIDLFADCGGYIVANSHHCISNIKPQNMVAMLTEARSYRPRTAIA